MALASMATHTYGYFVTDEKDYKPRMIEGYLGKGFYLSKTVNEAMKHAMYKDSDNNHKYWYLHKYWIDYFTFSSPYGLPFEYSLGAVLNYIDVPYIDEKVMSQIKKPDLAIVNTVDVVECFPADDLYINDIKAFLQGDISEVELKNILNYRQIIIKSQRLFDSLTEVAFGRFSKIDLVKQKMAGLLLDIESIT